ncbi:hypothetical protein M422DRAFT_255073 [Sphaerobolus stellatus SS14]|uniref:Tyr recombinase domain-containing protein n=1 Tax=Sphaerobolus stellatus (strain SS14) TaxID=990650 RepID=A0A0C9UFG5_SPHS4|nr:hypothetical protein M422DRAFT_255073 [Sphaerobolus stellatus SS14]
MKLAFAAFLCCREFTLDSKEKFDPSRHLSRGSIQFLPNVSSPTHVLSIPSSKTDPFRKGVSIVVTAAPGTSTCPVAALRYLFEALPADVNSPLFVGEDGQALTRTSFIACVKSAIARLGLDTSKYSGHSFGRGAATTAGAVGYSDYEIQQLGRWRSDAYRLYIDVPRERVLQVSNCLHWVQPPAQPFEPPVLPFAPSMA